jgi:hypothetical protein
VLTWGVVGAALGLSVALAPFWIAVHADLPPKGPSCGLEGEPASGTSRVGVERVDWSLTPTVRCVPSRSVVSRQRAEGTVNLARYRVLWPFAAVALVPVAWAVIFLVGLVLSGEGVPVARRG